MTESIVERANVALRPLASAMEADGYNLSVGRAEPRLELIVTATPEACEECLVPKAIFEKIATTALRDGGVELTDPVEITYPENHHDQ